MSKRSASPDFNPIKARRGEPEPEEERETMNFDELSDDEFVEGVLPPPSPQPSDVDAIEGVLPPLTISAPSVERKIYRVQREEPPVQSGSGNKPSLSYEISYETPQTEFDPNDKRHFRSLPQSEIEYLEESQREFPRFLMTQYVKKVKLNLNFDNFDGNIRQFKDKIDQIYGQMTLLLLNKYSKNDYYMVVISNDELNDPIVIGLKQIITHEREEFANKIFSIIQSQQEFIFKAFTISIYVSRMVSGQGRHYDSKKRKAPTTAEENSRKKNSVVSIKNFRNRPTVDCGYRAIFVGVVFYLENFDDEKYQNLDQLARDEEPKGEFTEKLKRWRKVVAHSREPIYQAEGGRDLCLRTNEFFHSKKCSIHPMNAVPIVTDCEHYEELVSSRVPLTIEHCELIQQYLCTFQIQLIIVNSADVGQTLYCGRPDGYAYYLPLYLEWVDIKPHGHYNWIRDYTKYSTGNIFCRMCLKGNQSLTHKCECGCDVCGKLPKCSGGEPVDCDICGRTFVNADCFDRHREYVYYGKQQCYDHMFCEKCEVEYKESKQFPHICNEFKCHKCYEKYTEHPHYCMLKPMKIDKLISEDENNKIIVCYDIESSISVVNGKHLHRPNLLCASVVCDRCWDSDEKCKIANICLGEGEEVNNACEVCGIGSIENIGYDCVTEFCDFLYGPLAQRAQELKIQIIVFAHNSRGYDGHFILQDLFTRKFTDKPDIIMNGLKLLKIGVNNISFIDSLSFFQQPLSALPKSFGFSDIVEKGFFPHKFNRPENYGYSGAIPSLNEFEPDFMKSASANECREWHSNFTDVWDFDIEIRKYCHNDVKILTLSVMEFRKFFKNITSLDPITRNFTLASVAFEHFRSSVLTEKTLGITPTGGYGESKQNSIKGNIWLDWLQTQYDNPIKREQKIGRYWVDGYIFEDRHVFEFLGCYFHGCELCYANNRYEPRFGSKSFNDVYRKTIDRIKYFEDRDYALTIIWEHTYNAMMRADDPLCDQSLIAVKVARRAYHKHVKNFGHINIRDAFFGGRTNNLFFNYECGPGEEIKYFDYISLYPTVLKDPDCQYPIGHPEIISEFTSLDISSYFGFIKCKILPPNDLYLPVLPVRSNDKLMFPLCGLCAKEMSSHCNHDRTISGTWFSEEIKLALTKGYVIKEIIEVLHYSETSSDIFKNYVQTWLKVKTEASGWPSECNNSNLQEQFLDEFEEKEHIRLDPDNMEKNPVLRFISKLMLNSLWGKFAQRPNITNTTIVTDYQQFHELVRDAKIEITGMQPISDEVLIFSHKFIDDRYDEFKKINLAVASMVTAYARMRLYGELDRIELVQRGRVLYFDTDSIIFILKLAAGWYLPKTGNNLGDMTDEVTKEYGTDAYISRFASGGPKNYAFEVIDANGVKHLKTKIKGINLTENLESVLDFDKIQNMAIRYKEYEQLVENVRQFVIECDGKHNVYSREFTKKYRVVSEKRLICEDGVIQTLPFGHI